MDWSKAKTILIIAFVITNLLLAYMLFDNNSIAEPTVSDDFIADVTKLLNTKDIKLNCNIPKDIPSLSTMTVEYEVYDIADINKVFFNGTSLGINQVEGIVEFKKDKEIVKIIDEKKLDYENGNDENKYNDLNEEKAIHLAEEFLEYKGFIESDMELTYKSNYKNTYYLEYTKIYNGIYLENTYTKFVIDKRGVKRFERFWLNPKEVGDNEIYISTAPKAILGLLNMDSVYGKTIDDISLCYYFDPVRHRDVVEDPKKTREGKAIPAWRIQFNDDSIVFLDEY